MGKPRLVDLFCKAGRFRNYAWDFGGRPDYVPCAMHYARWRIGSSVVGSRLTEDDVRAIRASTAKQKDIAAQFGVSRTTVKAIRSGRTWAWLA